MTNRMFRTVVLSQLAFVVGMLANPALAQDSGKPQDEAPAPGEIVVTAAKRAENLQAVPISVSAIGGDELSKSKVGSVDALVNKVVNLQLTSIVGDNTPIFALRGVSMSDYSLNQSSPVATYYDEVYKGNFAFLGVAMYDLERVEVLRGPQGTLYGKNTTGGAVNLISRNAKIGETSGYLSAGYGNYNRFDVNGAVNVPLGDKAALRIAATYSHDDGWFKNVVPGMPNLAQTSEYGLRATLNFEPTDRLKIVLRGSTSFQNPQNYGIFAQPENVNRVGLTEWQIASNIPDKRRARTWSAALTANYELTDSLTLTSITSYDKGSLHFFEDTDGQAIKLLEIPYDDEANQFAQDLRLTSNTHGPFDFILGLYYAREKVFNSTNFQIANGTDFNGDGVINAQDCIDSGIYACQFKNRFDQVKKSFAVYSDVKYKMGEHVVLHGGLRYTHDKGEQTGFRSDMLDVNGNFIANLIPPSNLAYSTDNLSGKVGVDYQFDRGNMVYASISRGYRAPSFNAQAFFSPTELTIAKAEKVTSYEVGAKTQFADRRVTLNMAAFWYDYRNQQFINVDPVQATQTLLNIPKSRIYGAEADLTVRASDHIGFHAGLGLLSTKIIEGTVSGTDVAGHKLSNAPTMTANLGLDLTVIDGGMGKLSLHPEMSYQSSQFFEVINVPRLEQKGYALVGGHIDWESANGRWNASVWGKNLANEHYFTSRVDLLAGFGFDYNHIGNPRTYGITVGTKF
ncbi:MAG: TonB-dependent receptor [Sphingomonadales bacterium]|nr:TonB-dependent receptor [Sphingomonadales bacterium]